MVKSKKAKQRALERKQYEQKSKDRNGGRDGCARLKALHQTDPEGENKQSFIAKLRFW